MMVVWLHALYVVPGVVEKLGASYFAGSGVDLFFVISGFIIVVTTSTRDVTPQKFFALRIIRVVPLYWLATLATITCAAYQHSFRDLHYSPGEIAKSLLFVPYVSGDNPRGVWPIVLNGWTLNYEMFFYALFALSLAAPRRLRLPGVIVTLGLLVIVGRVFGPFANPSASVYTSYLLLEFVAGMILAYAWLHAAQWGWLLLSLLAIAVGFYALGLVFSRLLVAGGAFLVVAGCLHPRIRTLQKPSSAGTRQCLLRHLSAPRLRTRGLGADLAAHVPAGNLGFIRVLHGGGAGALRIGRVAMLSVHRKAVDLPIALPDRVHPSMSASLKLPNFFHRRCAEGGDDLPLRVSGPAPAGLHVSAQGDALLVFRSPSGKHQRRLAPTARPQYARDRRISAGRHEGKSASGGLVTTWEDYLRLFRNVSDEIAIGEASPHYLWSETAPRVIAGRFPHAKIIVNLRNPVDRAYSDYLHMTAEGAIHRSFREQIDVNLNCTDRRIGLAWPFLEYGHYHGQLQRYFNEFPRSQIHISFYDDLERAPEKLLSDLFAFLGVDPDFAADLSQRHNAARIPKFAGAVYF